MNLSIITLIWAAFGPALPADSAADLASEPVAAADSSAFLTLEPPPEDADEDDKGSAMRDRAWELTLGGSGSNNDDFEDGSFNLALGLGYFLTDHLELAVRQSLAYADFGDSIWNGSTRVAIDYNFGDGALRPLIGANLGYVYGDTVDETGAAAPEVGLKWFLNSTTFINLLAEYQFFFDDSSDVDDAFDDGQFIYTLGLGVCL